MYGCAPVSQLDFPFLWRKVVNSLRATSAASSTKLASPHRQSATQVAVLDRPKAPDSERLQAKLRELIDPYLVLKLTQNISTMISSKRRGRVLYVRAHQMFTEAPAEVVEALATFVGKEKMNKQHARLLDDWIESKRSIIAAQREQEIARPYGEFHDLQGRFEKMNQKYFLGKIDAQITWSTAAQKQRRQSIQMGSYSDELKLIRIHPALDQKWVPQYFVDFVIYHEMLHQVHPRRLGAPKGCTVHTPAFRRAENQFEQIEKAKSFEALHLKRLLHY
jgi:predicted metal-dependent hydrolase